MEIIMSGHEIFPCAARTAEHPPSVYFMKSHPTHPSPNPAVEQSHAVFVFLISCVAAIGGFLFGFDSGVINGTVDGLRSVVLLKAIRRSWADHGLRAQDEFSEP